MKKVFILFCGHIRTYDIFEKTIQTIQNNILFNNKEFEFEFYLFTWENLDWCGSNRNIKTDINILSKFVPIENITIGEQINMNLPDEVNIFARHAHVKAGTKGETVYNMFYSWEKAFSILPNVDDSIVIKTRPDMAILSKVNLSEMKTDFINIMNTGLCKDISGNDFSTYNDFLAISEYNNIKFYCDVFSSFKEILFTIKSFRPEGILYNHLKQFQKIDLIDIDYELLRYDGKKNDKFWTGWVEINNDW